MVDRHHYLGHRVPFVSHIRYFIRVHNPEPVVVGCLQFCSPAWRLEARDRYLGWDDTPRAKRICNGSSATAGSSSCRRYPSGTCIERAFTCRRADRHRLGEPLRHSAASSGTLVDAARFSGTCYRAANWLEAGRTTGRGRNDRQHRHHGESPKRYSSIP